MGILSSRKRLSAWKPIPTSLSRAADFTQPMKGGKKSTSKISHSRLSNRIPDIVLRDIIFLQSSLSFYNCRVAHQNKQHTRLILFSFTVLFKVHVPAIPYGIYLPYLMTIYYIFCKTPKNMVWQVYATPYPNFCLSCLLEMALEIRVCFARLLKVALSSISPREYIHTF